MTRPSMLAALVNRALAIVVTCAACSMPMAPVDAGPPPPLDAGVKTPCDAPESCREQGLAAAVCRRNVCDDDVPCGSDFECSVGERCVRGRCAFTGCTKDTDCDTGRCLGDTYSCVECTERADCPRDRPVCNATTNTCQACQRDAECQPPGPGRCGPAGTCVHCLGDDDCPTGLSCAGSVCVGAQKSQPCPEGVQCGAGLSCVNVGAMRLCLPSCNLYQPRCEMGELCYRLTYDTTNSLIFESQGPIGVCFRQQAGFRGPRELCQRNGMGGSNCQPNLQCVPETATTAQCRTYCNPLASGGCVGAEKCVAFVGDFSGRRYGLCLPDTGFGERCSRDAQCRTPLTCQPYEDPSEFTQLSTLCQFSLGQGPGLAPCAPRTTDAGVVSADVACRSGACVSDPLGASATPFFCYSACEQDTDCVTDAGFGFCDADFSFVTPFGTSGTARGCRPGCASDRDCERYDAGVVCAPRVTVSNGVATVPMVCRAPQGPLGPGSLCSTGAQCRSGLCQLTDARGVTRQGTCAAPCAMGATCPTPGPGSVVGALECAVVSLFGSRGLDGVSNTPDDVTAQARVCVGARCQTTADCAGDGGAPAVCAPALAPAGLELRCLGRAGARAGGQPCTTDAECQSGVCGALQPPAVGSGRSCFEACTASSTCPGATSCRVGGLAVATARGSVSVDSCAP